MKRIFFLINLIFSAQTLTAQQPVENLVVITTDGLRWQDVFTGMDPDIANNKKYNQGDSAYIFNTYFDADLFKRRKKLMPFLWSVLADQGQIYGNRLKGNYVNNANPYWFSYPGYHEIMTGFPDTAVNSNEYKPNPHITVLEYLNGQPGYKGKVVAFGAWNAFDRILNEQRAGFEVVNGFDTVRQPVSAEQKLVNQMLKNSYRPFGDVECLDVFTHYAAMEYVKVHTPKVIYISYGETDEWAHHGYYRSYLDATRQVDRWLGELWSYIQSHPKYRNKTAMLITVDHGRGGINKDQWTDHGQGVSDASEIWFAVIAPGVVPAAGEVSTPMQLYQKQLAQTMARLMGKKYTAPHEISEAVLEIWQQKAK